MSILRLPLSFLCPFVPLVRLNFRPLDDGMLWCPNLSFVYTVVMTEDIGGALLVVTGSFTFLGDFFSLKIISAVVHVRLVLSRFP